MATIRRQTPQGSTALGTRIKHTRLDRKLTGQQLADKAGVTKGAVSQWEKGNVRNLRLENLFKVADALNVEARWLAIGAGESEILHVLGTKLEIEEGEAISRLRTADPSWRTYVLSLAMMDHGQQELMLMTMRQAVPDYRVERAYGKVPQTSNRRK